jgi:hypothetical protein
MKSAKRMVLIPEDMLNKFEQRQKLETPPILSNMMQKDAEMSGILYRDDLNDDVKEKLYHTNLERYLNLKRQKDSTTPTVRLAPDSEIEDKEPEIEDRERFLKKKKRNFLMRPSSKVFRKQTDREQSRF